MALNMFLNIDDIKGESTDARHKDELEVMSFSWGESYPTETSIGVAGKVQALPFHFTATISKASPALFLACASGKHFKRAVLTLVRTGGDQSQEFLVWKLSNVLISSYRTSGHQAESMPVEEFDLSFEKIEVVFMSSDATGRQGAAVKAGWDLKTNKSV